MITAVQKPTQWVSQLVVAEKKNGSLKICIDPRPLNKALKREHYQLPVIEDILPHLADARVFSKLELSSAFWQLELACHQRYSSAGFIKRLKDLWA